MTNAVSESNLSAHRDRIDGQPILIEMKRIDAMEELEVDSAFAQSLIQGGDHHIAHPRGHLPEERALVAEQNLAGQKHSHACAEGATTRVAVGVPEDHVVKGTHQRKLDHVGMRTVPDDPVAEFLVVEGAKPPRIGHHAVGDQPTCGPGDHRQQQPQPPLLGRVLAVEDVIDEVEHLVGEFDDVVARYLPTTQRRRRGEGSRLHRVHRHQRRVRRGRQCQAEFCCEGD